MGPLGSEQAFQTIKLVANLNLMIGHTQYMEVSRKNFQDICQHPKENQSD